MTFDFTYGMYADLLDGGLEHGLSFLAVAEYLEREAVPGPVAVLRHDVDRKPGNALDFARMEAERGIRSTYYVRTVDATFDRDVIEAIADLGHEVGYHYEDLDRADGHVPTARASFAVNLERLRDVVPVDTVCMHGNPLTPHDNRDLWGDAPDFAAHDLLGEAYLSVDFTDVTYFSDTGRTWRDGALKVKDRPVGEDAKSVQVGATPDLIDLFAGPGERRFYLLTHPDRWAGGLVEGVTETAFDLAKNVAKYGLRTVSAGDTPATGR